MEDNSRIKSIHPLITSGLSNWEIEAAERLMHLSESSSTAATTISSNTIIDDQQTRKKRRKQKHCISNTNTHAKAKYNLDPSSGKFTTGIILQEAAAVKEIITSSTEEVNSSESPSSCCSSSTSNLSLAKRKQWIEEIFGVSDIVDDDHNPVGFGATDRKWKPNKYRTLVQIYKQANLIAMI